MRRLINIGGGGEDSFLRWPAAIMLRQTPCWAWI